MGEQQAAIEATSLDLHALSRNRGVSPTATGALPGSVCFRTVPAAVLSPPNRADGLPCSGRLFRDGSVGLPVHSPKGANPPTGRRPPATIIRGVLLGGLAFGPVARIGLPVPKDKGVTSPLVRCGRFPIRLSISCGSDDLSSS